ncbi:MAG: glycerol-3-phosphate 1-O-acyltransferase PlsY [Planctomycetota bacterium]
MAQLAGYALPFFVLPLAAYLLGAIPFGLVLCRAIKGIDIREHGSRNIGATNAARVCGLPFFFATFALDFAKGLAPVLAGGAFARWWLVGYMEFDPATSLEWLAVVYGVAAIVGHTVPVYAGFRGGKAVATSFGVFVALAPWAALIALGVWGCVFLALRYVSLASMLGAVAAPAAYALLRRGALSEHVAVFVFTAAVAVLVVVRHRANIGRLLRGEESRVRFGKKRS